MSLRKRVTPTVVTLSENDILKITKTVKSFLIEDINNIVEEKQKPIFNELSQLKSKIANLERQIE
jgi:Na+/phosphate symporter